MKVIFLDIDGVLQPYTSRNRFSYDLKALKQELSQKYNTDYSIYNSYDIGACYYDWDKNAVERIKLIIKETGAKIVISSDWRSEEQKNKMKDFLKIWDMEQYWVGDTETAFDGEKVTMQEVYKYINIITPYWSYREMEIIDYVYKHKDITNYVVLDDLDFSEIFKRHFVKTSNLINDEQANSCIKILNDNHLEIKRLNR